METCICEIMICSKINATIQNNKIVLYFTFFATLKTIGASINENKLILK